MEAFLGIFVAIGIVLSIFGGILAIILGMAMIALLFIIFPVFDILFILFPSLIEFDLTRPDTILFSFSGIWWTIKIFIILTLPFAHLNVIAWFLGESVRGIFLLFSIIYIIYSFTEVLDGNYTYILDIQHIVNYLHQLIF